MKRKTCQILNKNLLTILSEFILVWAQKRVTNMSKAKEKTQL